MSLNQYSDFIAELPKEVTISANENKIIVTDHLGNTDIKIQEGANLTFVSLLKKGWEETKKLNFHLEGQNAEVNFIAMILGTGEETFPFETVSTHTTTNTNAYYFTRGAMLDKSRVDYRGNLVIKPGAQVTDSYLAHHSLMLSKNAKTNTIPCLEIEADDVKAGHAATIGKVDEDMLYYLATRGIDAETAKDLLIKGFMEAELHKIPSEELRQILTEEIENSINQYLVTH